MMGYSVNVIAFEMTSRRHRRYRNIFRMKCVLPPMLHFIHIHQLVFTRTIQGNIGYLKKLKSYYAYHVHPIRRFLTSMAENTIELRMVSSNFAFFFRRKHIANCCKRPVELIHRMVALMDDPPLFSVTLKLTCSTYSCSTA